MNDGCDAWFDVEQPEPLPPPLRVYARLRQTGALAQFEADPSLSYEQIIRAATDRSTGCSVAMVVVK
jgi:hypothetical protein